MSTDNKLQAIDDVLIEAMKCAEGHRHDIEHQIAVEAEKMIITSCVVNEVNVHQKIIDLLKLWRAKYDR